MSLMYKAPKERPKAFIGLALGAASLGASLLGSHMKKKEAKKQQQENDATNAAMQQQQHRQEEQNKPQIQADSSINNQFDTSKNSRQADQASMATGVGNTQGPGTNAQSAPSTTTPVGNQPVTTNPGLSDGLAKTVTSGMNTDNNVASTVGNVMGGSEPVLAGSSVLNSNTIPSFGCGGKGSPRNKRAIMANSGFGINRVQGTGMVKPGQISKLNVNQIGKAPIQPTNQLPTPQPTQASQTSQPTPNPGQQAPQQSKGLQAGMGAASMAGNLAGQHFSQNKQEELGGALSGASQGMQLGNTVASAVGSANPLVGAGITAAGTLAGSLFGKSQGTDAKKVREENEARDLAGKQAEQRADRRAADQQLSQGAKQQGAQISALYAQSGGTMTTAPRMEQPPMQQPFNMLAKKMAGGGANKTPLQKLTPKKVRSFKQGGKAMVDGMNIIPDGVTHGQKNENNVKNDKGLPIVNPDGKKVIELEKEELVMTLESSDKLVKMVNDFRKTKDVKLLDQIGDFMANEIYENTFDYSGKIIK